MPLLPIYNVSADAIFAVLAVVIVAYGRQYGITLSLIFGILMEAMLPSLDYLHLILYPAVGILGTVAMSDKTDRRLEMERNLNKKGENVNPLIRTPLTAMLMTTLFEFLNMAYVLLRGVGFDRENLTRIFVSVMYTTFVTIIIMIPLRRFLGLKFIMPQKIKKRNLDDDFVIDPSKGNPVIRPVIADNKDKKTEEVPTLRSLRRTPLHKSPTAVPTSLKARDEVKNDEVKDYNEDDFKPPLPPDKKGDEIDE
ncbi:MAG: hypothetical protein GYA87_04950 [Christensenellaceae bacterium]|nr:hypothetical protein [Christensenellaceae bacterium]